MPENLGNEELDAFNNNPPRLPADIIANALMPSPDVAALRARVLTLTDGYPLYQGLTSPGTWA